jgi:UPF0716 protein FxsA
MRWLIFLFPWLELWTLIQLGIETSALIALAWVFGTVVLGAGMIRRQGLNMIQQLQRDSETGLITPRFLGDDLAVVTSGLLFVVPGLITDFLGLLVLIGPVRRGLLRMGPARFRAEAHYTAQHRPGEPPQDNATIEGDFRRLDD